MATHNVYVSLVEGEFSTSLSFAPSNLDSIRPSDYVRFYRGPLSDPTAPITVDQLDGVFWWSSSPITIETGTTDYVQRQVKSGLATGANDILRATSGAYTGFATLTITAPPDIAPDPFTFPDLNDQNPNQEVTLGIYKIKGINQPVSVSVSGGVNTTVSINYKTPSTSGTAILNDTLIFRSKAPSNYGMDTTITINVGSYTTTVDVRNLDQPYVDQLIQLEIFSPSRLRLLGDIASFFGSAGQVKLSNYYRGGLYVPNIAENNSIPTSGLLKLSDLYGAYTAFYFVQVPFGRGGGANTQDGPKTISLDWNKNIDWSIGFGPNLESFAEYKYEVTFDEPAQAADVTILVANGEDHTVWSSTNNYLGLSVSAPQNTETFYQGTLKIQAKSVHDGTDTNVIEREIPWSMIFYGP